MRILALDLAMKTGWAIDSPGRPEVACGMYQCRDIGEDDGLGFYGLRVWLDSKIEQLQPDFLAYEAPVTFGGDGGSTMKTSYAAITWLNGLVAITKSCAAGAGIPYGDVNITAARAGFVGHKTKDKRLVLARCQLLGIKAEDDNAADAVGVWYWAKAHFRNVGDEIVRS